MTVTHHQPTTTTGYRGNDLDDDLDDVRGVKELFETHEDALLPIETQIRRYRKRDLYASHFHRTSCRILGECRLSSVLFVLSGGSYCCV